MAPKSHGGHKAATRMVQTVKQPQDLSEDVADLEDDLELSQMSHINTQGFKDGLFNRVQRDEYILMASLYGGDSDEFERLYGLRDPWKGYDNLAYSFIVSSFVNGDFKATLEVEYPQTYPKVPLKIKLRSVQPLQSTALEASINQDLAHLASQPAINGPSNHFQGADTLAEAVLDRLNSAASAFQASQEGKSLLEVREQEEELLREHQQIEYERAVARREEEAMKREQQLKEALRREKLRRHRPDAPELQEDEHDPNVEEEMVADIPFRFDTPISKWYPKQKEVISFKSVIGSYDLIDRIDKKVTIVSPVKFGKLLSLQFVMKQIFIPDAISSTQELQDTMDEIRIALEDCRKNDNKHIVKLYAYQIDHDTEDPDMPEWKITILSEFSSIGSILQSLQVADVFPGSKVRLYGNQILQGIELIEKLGYIHPSVHADNMLIFKDEKGAMQVRLSDSYGTKLWELVKKTQKAKETPIARTSGWTAPELLAQPLTISSKTCIWDFGVLVVKMAFIEGHDVENILTSPQKLTNRTDLDANFLEVLRACFQDNLRKRPTFFDLASFSFWKDGNKYINIPTAANPGTEPHLLRTGIAGEVASTWKTRWHVGAKLGSGGFGQVYKAYNVDDFQYYAVKRLHCATPKDLSDIWAEVKLLALVNHPGVVRYYNAWNEDELDEDDEYSQPTPAQKPQRQQVVHSVRSRRADRMEPASTGHDFMEPSLHRNIGPEFDSDDDEDADNDDSNPFAYQSAPSKDEYDDEDFDAAEVHAEDMDDLLRQPTTFDFNDDDDVIFETEQTSEALQTSTRELEVQSSSALEQRRPSAPRKSILYIQMELCETKTLSTLIKEGLPYRKDQGWRLFSEMLRALEHIHSYGIVHRDLKPANIFIGTNGHIKLGDFGLAVTGQVDAATTGGNKQPATLTAAPSSLGVGTKYYTAPELEYGGSGRYSTKADMFSLGVIFFQMCFPMVTDTEKMSNLRRISQESNFRMPDYFEHEGFQAQSAIIAKLISHDQDERPSAKELLDGSYLPEEIDPSAIVRYVNKLAVDQPDQYQRLMEQFRPRPVEMTRAQELAYLPRGRKSGMMTGSNKNPYADERINKQIEEIFEKHGAVPGDRINMLPMRPFYRLAATGFSEDGDHIQLPYDLTLPFAAELAEEMPPFPKNYSFGTVYRSKLDRRQPVKIPEIAYDHVSSSAKGLSLKDAEVIKVLDEVLTELPMLSGRPFVIYLNHGDLLDLILDYCKVPAEGRDLTVEELSYLHVSKHRTWKNVRSKLLLPTTGLSERHVSALGDFNVSGDLETVRDHLNAIFDDESSGKATRALARLNEIVTYVKKLRVQTTILISPLSNQSEPLYNGSTMFQCIDVTSGHVMAVGGRYDKTIEQYRQPEDPPGTRRAVGFRLSTKLLRELTEDFYFRNIAKKQKHKAKGTGLAPRLDVIITSFDESTLDGPCLDILQTLLAAGFRAEVSEFFPSMEQLDAAYGDLINYWLVIVRSGTSSKRQIKLRSPEREEKEVRVLELVDVLTAELEGKTMIPVQDPRLKKTWSHPAGDSAAPAPIVLTRRHKSKKVNRMNVADAVTTAAHEHAQQIGASTPVIAFAPESDAVLQAVRSTRMGDNESWRTLRQQVPLEDRAYLQELQEKLEELSLGGREGVFIVNYLTNASIYYDLCKKA